ncbi:MAG: Holliday junction DNA helicase RuvB C-terminal domain-containing protein, partial [Planctomycetota bacterium]
FGLVERLDPYPTEDLERIVKRAAGILGIGVTDEGARALAERSRGTPRIAGRFLKRARDRAQVRGLQSIDGELAREALGHMGVDARGLEEMDRRILVCLADHAPKPVALKTIAAVIGETEDTIEDVFEPHLLRTGLVQKTPRGRTITARGLEAIAREPGTDAGGEGAPLFDS